MTPSEWCKQEVSPARESHPKLRVALGDGQERKEANPRAVAARPLRDGSQPAAGLGGVIKPIRTEVSQSECRRIDRYRKDYRARNRVALGQDGAEWWPNLGTEAS